MNYLLDTNILLIYLRDNPTRNYIEETYDPFGSGNTPVISVVTVGEIRSIAKRNHWGARRMNILNSFLKTMVIADIYSEDVIDRYAEIDAYSQGKLVDQPLSGSARNMGKNDLWIAATASVTGSMLLTTDHDFSHLSGKFLRLSMIPIAPTSQ